MRRETWLARVALLWAGIVIGCSFIATPAKFQAPSLSLPTALEVGRETFRAMVLAELVLAIAGALLLIQHRRKFSLFWVAVGVLAVQWIGVMPLLSARTDAVIQGNMAGGPPWHLVYIVLEAGKVLLLLAVAFRKPESKTV